MAPSLSQRAVVNMLLNKLNADKDRGRDHCWYVIRDGETFVARTKVSHGGDRALSDLLVSKMAKQLNITTGTFVGLVNCSISREQYLHLVASET